MLKWFLYVFVVFIVDFSANVYIWFYTWFTQWKEEDKKDGFITKIMRRMTVLCSYIDNSTSLMLSKPKCAYFDVVFEAYRRQNFIRLIYLLLPTPNRVFFPLLLHSIFFDNLYQVLLFSIEQLDLLAFNHLVLNQQNNSKLVFLQQRRKNKYIWKSNNFRYFHICSLYPKEVKQ